MRIQRMIFWVFSLVLMSGCLRSVHPIYTEETIIFEPGLIGRWSEEGPDKFWEFSSDNNSNYQLMIHEDDEVIGPFEVHLCNVEGILFLDLTPMEDKSQEDNFYRFHLLRVHTFLHVRQINPILIMSFPEPDWIEKYLQTNPDALKHEVVDDEIILTAGSEDLQHFWAKQITNEAAFGEYSEMKLMSRP